MVRKGLDTMTVIKSICSGVGALSAVLLCASVLWSEMGDLDAEKLDEKVFTQYREEHSEQTETYRIENNESHVKIADVVGEIQGDVREIKTILERMEK